MVLWHERDLTNSSAERFMIPHAFVLTDHIIGKMTDVLANLVVNEGRMRENLLKSEGIMGERIALYLVGRGLGRQDAYKLVKGCISDGNFDPILEHIGKDELDDLLDPLTYLGRSTQLVENFIKNI
jgi:adenylosuccinate lyase